MSPATSVPAVSECRECCSFCDRLVHPSGCLDSGCEYLYLYDDEHSGRRFMGCMQKVFAVEIDVDLFGQAERTRHGFGGVKVTGRPLPRCRSSVERAYQGDGRPFDCVNPRFFQAPSADPAFDIRDSL